MSNLNSCFFCSLIQGVSRLKGFSNVTLNGKWYALLFGGKKLQYNSKEIILYGFFRTISDIYKMSDEYSPELLFKCLVDEKYGNLKDRNHQDPSELWVKLLNDILEASYVYEKNAKYLNGIDWLGSYKKDTYNNILHYVKHNYSAKLDPNKTVFKGCCVFGCIKYRKCCICMKTDVRLEELKMILDIHVHDKPYEESPNNLTRLITSMCLFYVKIIEMCLFWV